MSLLSWCRGYSTHESKETLYQFSVVYKINEGEYPYSLESRWLRYEPKEDDVIWYIMKERLHKQIAARIYDKFEYEDIKSVTILELEQKIMERE